MVLAEAGWDVTILEKGRNTFGDLLSPTPSTIWSNDELKSINRMFVEPDPEIEPRTYRRQPSDAKPFRVGAIQALPQTVGGASVHFDAKTPRFWDIDFAKLSMLGPVGQPNVDVVDWPFTYEEIAPYYEQIEKLIGVAGDIGQIGPVTLSHAPRAHPLPMPAGPPEYGALRVAAGAEAIGLHPFEAPMAINSVPYDGRPACNNCGFCSGYGCPIHARAGALAPLRRALKAGAELRSRAVVTAVRHDGSRVTGVTWRDSDGRSHQEAGDLVVLAALGIESIRLALLSEVPDPHDLIGRYQMFHWFTEVIGFFTDERLHGTRGRAGTHVVDDFADPDFPGARAAAASAGLPYLRGGTLEVGGSSQVIDEAGTYVGSLLPLVANPPFGSVFKKVMRAGFLRDRSISCSMVGEDLPYATNRTDLDPIVKDYRGLPVARITYSPGVHEHQAFLFYRSYLAEIFKAAGAVSISVVPRVSSAGYEVSAEDVPAGSHIMGGMRMGSDPSRSVTDTEGRVHTLDGLAVADGSVFCTSGGHNPTLTIMAVALRNAERWSMG